MSAVDLFLKEVQQISRLNDDSEKIRRLATVLNLNLEANVWIPRINNELSSEKGLDIDLYELFDNEWPAFNELISAFIKLSAQVNPWSCLESYDLYTNYMSSLSVAFNNNARGYLLSAVVRDSIKLVLALSSKLDHQLYYKEHLSKPRMTNLASIILKLFNHIRSQINDTHTIKKSLILFISNKLCSIYFGIGNPLLCRNIFSNMNNANLQFKEFPLIEQIQYRFHLSKFYLIKDQLVDSFAHLTWCLSNCPVTATKHVTKILEYLIPLSIVVGKRPNFLAISQTYFPQGDVPEYIHVYAAITNSIKCGNIEEFSQCIVKNTEFLKERSLLLMMQNKCKILILRNLVRKVWLFCGKPSTLDYDATKLAIKLSMGHKSDDFLFRNVDTLDDYNIENVYVTLIDQNLLKGKLLPRLHKVALSKTDAFPRIDNINETRFLNNSKADAWMN